MKMHSKKMQLLTPVMLLSILFLLVIVSCQKDELYNNSSMPGEVFSSMGIEAASIIYFPSETFTIVSKDPLVQSRSLTNKNFRYFENFILKVQNGISGKTKVPKIEISIDGSIVLTNADFKKNIASIPLTGLTESSTLTIKLEGSKGRFITVLIECSLMSDVIEDIDNNYYHTIKIGNRWWTTENLRTTRFNDGTPLQLVTDDAPWNDYTPDDEGRYCFYNNDESYKDVYGALYNLGAAAPIMTHKEICPDGWHVSNYNDFWNAVLSVDPDAVVPEDLYIGGEFKEAGFGHWQSPNTGATNSTGFTGLPGGRKGGTTGGMGQMGNFWLGYGEYFSLEYNTNRLWYWWDTYQNGYSIRCVKNY